MTQPAKHKVSAVRAWNYAYSWPRSNKRRLALALSEHRMWTIFDAIMTSIRGRS